MSKRRPAGDGMVRKREDGRWEGRIVVGHKENGDSIFRYVSAGNQKALTEKLHREMSTYRGVDLTENSRMTLGEWLDQWLVSKEGMVRPGTLNGYRGYIENHIRPCLGEKRISQIKAVDIQRFYDMLSRKLAGGTVRRIHTTLHGILKAAAQARLIPRNPVEEVTPPKFSYQEKKVLTAEQVDRLMEVIQKDTLWHDLFYTELTTGLRRGELCGLRWSDVDLEHKTITIENTRTQAGKKEIEKGTKTASSTRTLYLPDTLCDMLKAAKEHQQACRAEYKNAYDDNDYVVVMEDGRPFRPNYLSELFGKFLADNDLPKIVLHELRHPYVKPTTKKFITFFEAFRAAI